MEDRSQSAQNSLQEGLHNLNFGLCGNALLEIDDTESGFILDLKHRVAESFVDELEDHASEVDLNFRGELGGHISHSNEHIVDDARIL